MLLKKCLTRLNRCLKWYQSIGRFSFTDVTACSLIYIFSIRRHLLFSKKIFTRHRIENNRVYFNIKCAPNINFLPLKKRSVLRTPTLGTPIPYTPTLRTPLSCTPRHAHHVMHCMFDVRINSDMPPVTAG